jgi:probable F420-dependent oxidoreductase
VTPRLGLTPPLEGAPLGALAGAVPELEALGFTDLWTRETADFDATGPLALAAATARTARLGTAVAAVTTRGPALLAMQAASLAEAAPGRFALGVGVSSPAIVRGWNGLAWPAPLAATRDALRFLRAALAGERVDAGFETFRVHGFRLTRSPATPPPIFVAALRERMLRLAAREADGVLLGMLTADDLRRVAAVLREERAAVPGRPFEVAIRIAVCPTPDARRARAAARRMLAAYLSVPTYARLHAWLGRSAALRPVWDAWARGDRAGAEAAVPQELVDGIVVHGDAGACRAAVARFVEAGATLPILAVWPLGGDPWASVRALAPRA